MKKIFLLAVLFLTTSCNQFAQMNSGSEFAPMAEPPKVITESFIQGKETRALDILWVIDDSGSMKDDQIQLGDNFDKFIQNFVKNKNDFQMAITTTDTTAAKRGLLVQDSDFKLSSIEAAKDPLQFMADFKTLIKVGTNGSGTERGLEATKGFLERYGESFFRKDAFLAVVIVSDEKDHSKESVSHYVDLLKSSKTNPGLVRINAIVNFSEKDRYEDAVKETSGVIADISKDFSQSLSDLGSTLFELTSSFPLSKWPDPSSMRVYVDGKIVQGYNWDSKTNSVIFSKGNLPKEGSEIRLVYNTDK